MHLAPARLTGLLAGLTALAGLALFLTPLSAPAQGDDAESPWPEPASRMGGDMLGQQLNLEGLRWLNTPDGKPLDLTGKVTLVRWWTEECPFCRGSLPAITALARRYGPRGLQTLAVYHPKPIREMEDQFIIRSARGLGYTGAIGLDLDWTVLEREYLAATPRPATSVSFVLDRRGVIRYVHAGPEFRPTKTRGEEHLNRDYEEIRETIEGLLAEPAP